ncbi:Crp/Fnr family transcriptional regulator [Novipirellula herctigrandis]
MAVFGGLNPKALQIILDNASELALASGDYFFHEGDPADSLFVIEAGTVLIQRYWNGEPIILGRLVHGDCFGEMSLIDFQGRSASVVAESHCQAIEIPAKTLRTLYQHDLEQYAMIMMNLGREVSRRLRAADECLFRLQQDPTLPVEAPLIP